MDVVGGGFARFLYVPEDGTRFSSQVAASLEDALREAGFATGPDGDGVAWQPFRPAGALSRYAEGLGLVYPTIEVEWYDDPHQICDPYLSPRGPWSRCPDCGRLVPTHGTILTADDELVTVTQCASCGADFDSWTWEHAPSRTLFETRLVVALVADHARSTRPTFRQGCKEFVHCVEEVVGAAFKEMLVRG
ncbi:MAG: hypothetical protein R3E66_12595 [bacterium]